MEERAARGTQNSSDMNEKRSCYDGDRQRGKERKRRFSRLSLALSGQVLETK